VEIAKVSALHPRHNRKFGRLPAIQAAGIPRAVIRSGGVRRAVLKDEDDGISHSNCEIIGHKLEALNGDVMGRARKGKLG